MLAVEPDSQAFELLRSEVIRLVTGS